MRWLLAALAGWAPNPSTPCQKQPSVSGDSDPAITGTWIAYAALIAFTGSLCGALYPAWMAARKDPIDALAYE